MRCTRALHSVLCSPASSGSCPGSWGTVSRIFGRVFLVFSFLRWKVKGVLNVPQVLQNFCLVGLQYLLHFLARSTAHQRAAHSTAQESSWVSWAFEQLQELRSISSLANVGVQKDILSSPIDQKALLLWENLLRTRQTNDDNYRRRDNPANLPILGRCRAASSGPSVEDLVQLLFLGTVSFGFNWQYEPGSMVISFNPYQ